MRPINLIVVHCSASPPDQDIGVAEIRREHMALGWIDCGYHWVIRRDGTIEAGRPELVIGAHAAPFNTYSIGVCLVGGVDSKNRAQKNFMREQYQALLTLLVDLRVRFPGCHITGHRDLSPDLNHDGVIQPREWIKDCPCFDVSLWCAQNGIDPGTPPEPPTAAVAAIQ